MITFEDVKQAQERITPHILRTPLVRIPALDEFLGCKVYVKPENFQITGSFKLRGATNSILALTPEEKKKGVVASSSGNHAQGVAYAATAQGIDATIVMPENVNPMKLASVERYGANILLAGTKTSERDAKVQEIIQEEGRVEIHPFASDNVKSGQGTIGLEILEDQPEMDLIVSPIGGGGLISGVGVGAKGIKPTVTMIGVEPAGASRYTESFREGKPITLATVNTIADGTRTDQANPENYQLMAMYVDRILTVEDEEIKKAIKLLIEKGKMVAEPSSVMGIAAFMRELPFVKKKDRVCFILSGGNNDLTQLAEILSTY